MGIYKLDLNDPQYMKTQLSTLLSEKHTTVHSVPPNATVKEAALVMTDHHIRSVLVLDQGDLVGIFTERDVLLRIVMEDRNPSTTLVNEVMTKNLTTVSPTTLVHEALNLITNKRFGHLPVMKDGKLAGIISIGDITKYFSHCYENEAGTLWSYITGDDPHVVSDFIEERV